MKTVLWSANERINIPDLDDATAKLIMLELQKRARIMTLPDGNSGRNAASASARIYSGFGLGSWTVDVSASVVLSGGTGVFPLYEQGVRTFGVIMGEMQPSSQTLNVAALGDDTYGLYVRYVRAPAETRNRMFWSASLAEEYSDSVATRNVPVWQWQMVSMTATQPGHGEWVLLYTIQVLTNKIHAITDYRVFFYEGSANAAFDGPYDPEWGDNTNDRNANRALYGVSSEWQWAQLVRRQLQDIIGVKHYTLAPRTLTSMAAEHKSSGAHGNVYADSILCTGLVTCAPAAPGSLVAHAIRPPNMAVGELSKMITCRSISGGPEKQLLNIDRQGAIGAVTIFDETMLYGIDAAIPADIPGKRWGIWFTGATAASFGFERISQDTADRGGLVARATTATGVGDFAGFRTGGSNNNQKGWYLVSNKPKVIVAFSVPDWTKGFVELGFMNDTWPSDVSEAHIEVGTGLFVTDDAKARIVGSDASVVNGTVGLLGAAPVNDTLYKFQFEILNGSTVRATSLNTGLSETLIKPGSAMIEASGGFPIPYTFYISAINASGGDTTRVKLKRFIIVDEAFVGRPSPLFLLP
jgi:hypothetical protein